jgi:uncharacterized protein YjiS (DUF1127 family)
MTTRSKMIESQAIPPVPSVVAVLSRLVTTWTARHRARRALARLDDHLLRDIGLDRMEAERETSRRFWQD